MLSKISTLTLLILLATECSLSSSFTLVMMGARRGKGNLKKRLDDSSSSKPSTASLNQGRGQEITGVNLPTEGKPSESNKTEYVKLILRFFL